MDVYAGDDALRDGATPHVPQGSFAYIVHASADPDVLCRLANQFNLANVAPWRVELAGGPDSLVTVRVEMRGIAATVADSIRRKLLQLTCVVDVALNQLPAPSQGDSETRTED